MRDGGLRLLAFLILATGFSAGAAPDPQAEDPTGWSAAVEREIADSEYRLTWQEETALAGIEAAWQAPNRAHDFRTYFTGDGIRLVPRSTDGASWEWGLSLVRVCRPGSAGLAEAARLSVAGPEAEYDRGSVVERYVNDRRGLEQLFEIEDAPGGARGPVHLDLALSGTLSPVIAEDGQAIDFATPGGVKVLHYASLLVVDARGTVLPSWIEGLAEPGLPGIRLVFDDAGAVYPVTVDPLTTSAAWTAEGDQASAWFGYSVATAGDVNGDGYSDVIVGAYRLRQRRDRRGTGLSSTSARAVGPRDDRRRGRRRATRRAPRSAGRWRPAGDVNGDGYADVIVGALQLRQRPGRRGAGLRLSRLGRRASRRPPAWTAESDQASAELRLLGGDRGRRERRRLRGRHRRAPALTTTARRTRVGPSSTSARRPGSADDARRGRRRATRPARSFGCSVATAGDVNGDGYADVIVGATGYDNGQTDEGRAFVYLGSAVGTRGDRRRGRRRAIRRARSFGVVGRDGGRRQRRRLCGRHRRRLQSTTTARPTRGAPSSTSARPRASRRPPAWTRGERSGGRAASATRWRRRETSTATATRTSSSAPVPTTTARSTRAGVRLPRARLRDSRAPPAWTAESDQSSARLRACPWRPPATSTATATRTSSSGRLAVRQRPEANEGRAFVYHGSASGAGPARRPGRPRATRPARGFGFSVGDRGRRQRRRLRRRHRRRAELRQRPDRRGAGLRLSRLGRRASPRPPHGPPRAIRRTPASAARWRRRGTSTATATPT